MEANRDTTQVAEPQKQQQAVPDGALAASGRGFTGTQLKLIAIGAMALDHLGAVVLEPLLISGIALPWMQPLDIVLRCIGRIAFPIFCFLLVQGFLHTSNVKKYALRLAAFALLSEVPFDLALRGVWMETNYQNVFVTLLVGLLCIWAIDALRGKVMLQVLAGLAFVVLGDLLKSDYGAMGVVTIVLFYLLRKHKKALFVCVGLWLWLGIGVTSFFNAPMSYAGYPVLAVLTVLLLSGVLEALGAFSFLFLARYNGQRGAKLPKYLFYAFYPAHLLVYYGLCLALRAALN